MTHLNLHVSNRLEDLLDALAAAVAPPLPDPLEPEVVVVPNQGIARWVAYGLAERLRICANVRFPFPDQFLVDLARRVAPDAPDGGPFSPDVLTWRVAAVLPDLAARLGGGPVARYLDAARDPGARERRRLELAREVARTFELYTVFRPELLAAWERGAEPGDWQAELWRILAAEHPGAHRAALFRALIAAVPRADPSLFPRRVHVFGVGALAPLRLEAFRAVAGRVEVNLFTVNPSRAYWAEVRSARERAERERRGGGSAVEHLEEGNPLLAAWGRQGRAFFAALAELPVRSLAEAYRDPGRDTLLACLQTDILDLVHRGRDGTPRRRLDPADRSVRVHACHGPLREVEVLRDELLAAFRDLPGLEPRDVLVAAPDVETYAPYVRAVFDGDGRIPYAVADRGGRARSRLVAAFLDLLSLAGGRFPASRVLDLLAVDAVARRFGFEPGDRERVVRWVEETRIRWGRDAEARQRLGLPAFGDNSWRAGLDRLLLGYAMAPEDGRLFQGVLPADVAGDAARTLGCLAGFCDALFTLDDRLARSRDLEGWADVLLDAVDAFFLSDDDGEAELQLVRGAVAALAELGRRSGFRDAVPLAVVRAHLADALERAPFGGGYLSGGVTFCSLRPLRGIPFRFVALLGMDDGAFPRSDRPPGFDRIARAPRPGDPSVADEDRYLFLETVLAARDRLHVSYVGRSSRDDADLPPSVVVSDLLDAVAEGFSMPGADLPDALVTRHRLHGFHPDYFTPGTGLVSFSREDHAAARSRGDQGPAPLVPDPLPEPDDAWRTVDVARLARFFSHPARFFVTERLGFRLDDGGPAADDAEPFEIDGLDRYQLVDGLVRAVLDGEDPDDRYPAVRAEGRLPPGRPGEIAFRAAADHARALADAVRPHLGDGAAEPVAVDVVLGPFRVVGRVGGIGRTGPVRYRPVRIKGKDLLAAWVEHLVLCAAGKAGRTVVVGADRAAAFHPPDDPGRLVAGLLDLYWQGLAEPLRLFPETSLAFAEKAVDPEKAARAPAAARNAWEGGEYHRGERNDPYLDACFRGTDPLDGPFERLAVAVFEPLLAHRKKMP